MAHEPGPRRRPRRWILGRLDGPRTAGLRAAGLLAVAVLVIVGAGAASAAVEAGRPFVSGAVERPSATGTEHQPAAAPNLSWVRTGGPLGGLGYDVRMRPDDPDTMLVTDAYAGVFKSTDAGASWQPSNTSITIRTGTSGDAIPVFCLTIDPHDNDIVWAGTQYLRGIFRSKDGGASWTQMNNGVVESQGITFRGITVDPRSSDIVYAAAELSSWQWNSGTEKRGREFDLTKGVVYKTIDGGATWKAVWRGDNLARYIWIDPDHPDTVYVSTGIFDREAANSDPTGASKATPGGEGIVKSTNGGVTWSHANNGLGNLYVGSLFMHPDNPQILLAGTGNNQYPEQGGVYLSTDGGASWHRTLDEPVTTSVEFSVADPNVAYAGSLAHVFRSEDGGLSWDMVTGPQFSWGPPGVAAGFPIDFEVDPRNPARLFANNYGGGNFLSEDGGVTWSVASKGYTGAQSRDIAVDPTEPGRVITASRSGIFKTLNGGTDWAGLAFPPESYIEWNAVAIDPEDGQHILAANNLDARVAESRDGGRSWVPRGSALGQGFAFRSFAFASSDTETVYAGTGAFTSGGQFDDALPGKGLYVSHDGGKAWTAANDATSASVQAAVIAVHPADPETAYVAALDDGLLKTTDGGTSWSRLAGTWPATAPVRALALSSSDPQTVFVATGAGMYVTLDGGATWQKLAAGFAPESALTSIVVDPADSRIVYVSDRHGGVYRTENGGAIWAPINQDLRTKAVNRLAVSADGDHLYAATEGEGVFRLDLGGSPPPMGTEPPVFADVPDDSPYLHAILGMYANGIISGYTQPVGPRLFKPADSVLRAQFAKMIVGSLSLPVEEPIKAPFGDLGFDDPADLYPHQFVAVAAAAGITRGTTATTFSPYVGITRAQVITMVVRAAGRQGGIPLADPPPEYFQFGWLAAFTDPTHGTNAHLAEWNGLLMGIDLRGWDPWQPATRGEVAQILWNFFLKRGG